MTDLLQFRCAGAIGCRGQAASALRTNEQVVAAAAAVEGLTASLKRINHQVLESSKLTIRAVADARRTDSRLRVIMERTERIRDVVGLIINITGRTNLLALGTAIEEACIGEAEKELSVVASEVNSLADQAATATEEIDAQIARIRSATRKFVDTIGNIMSAREKVGST